MKDQLFYVGITHQSAPLAIRERLRADRDRQVELLSRLSELGAGRMVLATCERFEVYATAANFDSCDWIAFLGRWFQVSTDRLAQTLRMLSGSHAAEHLIRVAAGLESRIVGERQILGQVRNAHQAALEQGTLDANLSLLARTAVRAGKRVRQETRLDSGRSIVTMAMEWLNDQPITLTDGNVAVVGSGRLAGLVASEVVKRRPRRIIILGRNENRAAELALRFHAERAAVAAIGRTLDEVDVVFACTASPTYLIDSGTINEHRSRRLLLLDLCVPRNVDPSVVRRPCVTLSHLDELVDHGLSCGRSAEAAPGFAAIQHAETIVGEELDSFLRWRHERNAVPKIAELLGRAAASAMGKGALHEQIMRLKAGISA